MIHLPRRSHLPVGRLCRNLVKKTKVPTYLPLPEGKKLRRKSKVPTYLPLWKGQKVHQNSKVPTYLPIWRVKKTLMFAKCEKWIKKTSVFFKRCTGGREWKKKVFVSITFVFPHLFDFSTMSFCFEIFHELQIDFIIIATKILKKHMVF